MRVIKWEDMIDPAREGRMNTENKMKQIVIIAGVVIIFLLAAPYLYKVLLYGVGWVIWGFMAYFIGGVP